MRRSMLLVTMALMRALMLALSGSALASHGEPHGGGGHFQFSPQEGLTFTGGHGGSDKGGGGGGSISGVLFDGLMRLLGGVGIGGSTVSGKGGGGSGGCVTIIDERQCSGGGSGGDVFF